MEEKRICKQTGKEYTITQGELDLLDKISPVLNGKKYLIPPSKYHPDVSHQRHLARRNERILYKGKCTFTGESLITNINPKQGYKDVYNFRDWRGDAWDPFEYGILFDTNKSFTEQFGSMFSNVPQKAIQLSMHMDNCDYCNYGFYAKDCYMCTSAVWSEKCYYSNIPLRCYLDVDGYANTDCSYCYQCFYAMNCYQCQYAIYSNDCKSSYFLLDCRDCEYCFGCVNLLHKKYYIFNEKYDKNTYFEAIKEILKTNTMQELHSKFVNFSLTFPRRATRGSKNENSIGDLNFGTKNCKYCFDVQDCKNSSYCWVGGVQSADMYRCTLTGISTRLYECIATVECDSCAFCISGGNSYQCFYCIDCRDCEYCFGCVRIMHKKYCIFNKQYTKEEYEQILPGIIESMQHTGERGEFFDPSYSNFPYNDTNAHERFPEDKNTILERGRKWIDEEENKFTGEAYIPESIDTYQNDAGKRSALLNATLVCKVTGKAFRLTEQELNFYIKFNIPIPDKHPLQRYEDKIKNWRMPRKLRDRKCDKCEVDIKTSYSTERLEIVYCEECYNKEIYG